MQSDILDEGGCPSKLHLLQFSLNISPIGYRSQRIVYKFYSMFKCESTDDA